MKKSVFHANFRVSKNLDGEYRKGEINDGIFAMEGTPRG